ncbi:membrane protein insertion efficiency factor YidD [Daeguia caeni]|uniref:Putative membrane protein insertion efficiency factor n=1 Tax=Daeguia caeni TaxID=439612 RepID=A0ABV9H6L3_9HYPH
MCSCGENHAERPQQHKRRHTRNFTDPWRRTPGRLLGTALIRLYQLTLSSFIGNSCRHLPTCSEYAYEAIARHGLWNGGWMGLFRVMRCGPLGTHGFDPVPRILPARARWYLPWRFWNLTPDRQTGEN